MAEVRPYENQRSEPDSIHLHVYLVEPESQQLYYDMNWDQLHDDGWNRREIVRAEHVDSVETALRHAQQIANEQDIPLICLENNAA